MFRRSRELTSVGLGKTILGHESFDGSHVWRNRRTLSQDAQKGRSARPQRVKGRSLPSGVR